MRALVVEDDPTSALLSQRVLEQEGFAVDTAATGLDAIERVRDTRYDLVILDLGLPDLDGLQVMTAIRAGNRMTPVLVLTGAQDAATTVRALDAGADDYLRKPPVPDELSARVRSLMRRAKRLGDDHLACGNLTLDRLSRQLFVRGAEVSLTGRELALLEQLLLARGDVVSRTVLLERVWAMDFDPGSNVIDVNVARIRRKLASAGADVAINARRGVGFTLELVAGAPCDGAGLA